MAYICLFDGGPSGLKNPTTEQPASEPHNNKTDNLIAFTGIPIP